MTDQEAFEAGWASSNPIGMVATAEVGWHAARAEGSERWHVD